MLIDWFTVGAQVLNFVILVWLMKRFLYKPILHAIDEREKRIAEELANADSKKAEAQKESDDFKHKNEEFDRQRTALLENATREVNAERQRLLNEARNAADAVSAKRQETLKNDAHNLYQALSRRTQDEVFAIARKTLTDLSSTDLERHMVELFIRRLREMDDSMKAKLADAIKRTPDPALVRSAFELPAEQRNAVQQALNETFSAEIHIRFDTVPDLIGGIELTMNGQKVAWSIADYLASMEHGVDDLLNGKDKNGEKAGGTKGLTSEISKRAYELFEKGGRKSDSAIQDWSQAERDVRKEETKNASKNETEKVKSKPEEKSELSTDAPIDSKTKEVKPEAETKSDIK